MNQISAMYTAISKFTVVTLSANDLGMRPNFTNRRIEDAFRCILSVARPFGEIYSVRPLVTTQYASGNDRGLAIYQLEHEHNTGIATLHLTPRMSPGLS